MVDHKGMWAAAGCFWCIGNRQYTADLGMFYDAETDVDVEQMYFSKIHKTKSG